MVDQLVEGVEFDVASYVLYERDCYFIIVDIAGEVEDVYFQCDVVTVVQSRAVADVQHSFVALFVQIDPNGIYADTRNNLERFVCLDIGGRKT